MVYESQQLRSVVMRQTGLANIIQVVLKIPGKRRRVLNACYWGWIPNRQEALG